MSERKPEDTTFGYRGGLAYSNPRMILSQDFRFGRLATGRCEKMLGSASRGHSITDKQGLRNGRLWQSSGEREGSEGQEGVTK